MRSHPRAKAQAFRTVISALRKKAEHYRKADDQFAEYNGILMDEAAGIVEKLLKKEVRTDAKVRETAA